MNASVARPRRVLIVAGTRPEVIKLAPLVHEMRSRAASFDVHLCTTGQHRELLADALRAFSLTPDTDLALMEPGQDPAALLGRILGALPGLVERLRPDTVVVQGDTTTSFGGALAAYYAGVPIAHVEAGLRSGDPLAPFPEEQHRRMVDQLARWRFAPTETARRNLLAEGHPPGDVYVTGNTGIDALRWLERRSTDAEVQEKLAATLATLATGGERASADSADLRIVVATVHRREHGDRSLTAICDGLTRVAGFPRVRVVMPIHPNPAIRGAVDSALGGTQVQRVPPLSPLLFVALLRRAALVITDSGGVQEEAAGLGVPALIVRSRSDRPESVRTGDSRVVGHDPALIFDAASRILDGDPSRGGSSHDLFGDGRAAIRIADILAIAE